MATSELASPDPWVLLVLNKLAGAVLFVAVPVFAVVLGLQVIPLDPKDPHRDLVRRLLGCAVSSAVVGIPVLVMLHVSFPSLFAGAASLAGLLELPPKVGPWAVVWSVFLVCALPGWWLVGAVMRHLAKELTTKELPEIVEDVAQAVKKVL